MGAFVNEGSTGDLGLGSKALSKGLGFHRA